MPRETVKRIDGRLYRLVATVEEGQTLYFAGGKSIAVERFDMRPGSVEFDFQVNSRAFRGGRPEQIAAMQTSLDREFLEQRVKSNVLGLPFSIGDPITMVRQRRITFTYGELRPQIFRSQASTQRIAWRVWFKRTWYTGNADVPGANVPGAKLRSSAGRGIAVIARGNGSAQIGAASDQGQQTLATGGVDMLTNEAGMLFVYVPANDGYKHLPPFDRRDMIFTSPSIADHIRSWMAGRGW